MPLMVTHTLICKKSRVEHLQGLAVVHEGRAALILPLLDSSGQLLYGCREPLAHFARLQRALQIPVRIPALHGLCLMTCQTNPFKRPRVLILELSRLNHKAVSV